MAARGEHWVSWKDAGITPKQLGHWLSTMGLPKSGLTATLIGLGYTGAMPHSWGGITKVIYGRIPFGQFKDTFTKILREQGAVLEVTALLMARTLYELNGTLLGNIPPAPNGLNERIAPFLVQARQNFGGPRNGLLHVTEDEVELGFVEGLLRILGWETGNVREVQRKRPGRRGVPDYVVKLYGIPELVIEAKDPRVPLDDRVRDQALGYTREVAPKGWFLVTNARELALYSAELPAVPIYRIDLEKAGWVTLPEVDFARLNLLSKPSFEMRLLRKEWYQSMRNFLPS